NAARRDAGAREPAWGFETDPYYERSLRMFSARPRGSARRARFAESGGFQAGDGRVACRGLLLGVDLAPVRGRTVPRGPQSRRVELAGEGDVAGHRPRLGGRRRGHGDRGELAIEIVAQLAVPG